jgi:hypothetical protein
VGRVERPVAGEAGGDVGVGVSGDTEEKQGNDGDRCGARCFKGALR